MKYQAKNSTITPVLAHFTDIREMWLGFLQPTVVQRAKKRRVKGQKKTSSPWLLGILAKIWKKPAKLVLNLLIIIGVITIGIWQGPKVFYTLFPISPGQVEAEELAGDFTLHVDQSLLNQRQAAPSERNFQPPYNENLPEGDWLIIPRIGVRSTLQPTAEYEDALETGLWLAPDFGKPGDRKQPMIVAGHRFGFQWWWQDDYWQYHSFYLLPELEAGDTIEVISEKRKYIYKIYEGHEGQEIMDYQADLIVYTCKYLDSPVRIFRYAKLLPPEGGTALGVL